ncbi:MAG TPA: FmdB family zinc ribbon protein [Terriglobia bacterium]|nr:FmdB family zinc ribbon protein [Terriglobia bacterium]
MLQIVWYNIVDSARRSYYMPQYEFVCKECKKKFTLQMTLEEYSKGTFGCPHCKSKKVHQEVAAFFAVSAKKS